MTESRSPDSPLSQGHSGDKRLLFVKKILVYQVSYYATRKPSGCYKTVTTLNPASQMTTGPEVTHFCEQVIPRPMQAGKTLVTCSTKTLKRCGSLTKVFCSRRTSKGRLYSCQFTTNHWDQPLPQTSAQKGAYSTFSYWY